MRTSIFVREALKADGVGHSFRHYRKWIHSHRRQMKDYWKKHGRHVQAHVGREVLNQIFPR